MGRVFDNIIIKNIDELAEWLNKHGVADFSPWNNWFDKNYCSKCEAEIKYIPEFNKECECSWCELNGKCKFFKDMNDIPNNEQVIKMWLESEDEQYEENDIVY